MTERACFKALQIHGGYGYMWGYDGERMYRDQRLVIARQILGAGF